MSAPLASEVGRARHSHLIIVVVVVPHPLTWLLSCSLQPGARLSHRNSHGTTQSSTLGPLGGGIRKLRASLASTGSAAAGNVTPLAPKLSERRQAALLAQQQIQSEPVERSRDMHTAKQVDGLLGWVSRHLPATFPSLVSAFNSMALYNPPALETSSGGSAAVAALPLMTAEQSASESSGSSLTALLPTPPAVPVASRRKAPSGASICMLADETPPLLAFCVQSDMDGIANLDLESNNHPDHWYGESYLFLSPIPIFPKWWDLAKPPWRQCEVSPAVSHGLRSSNH